MVSDRFDCQRLPSYEANREVALQLRSDVLRELIVGATGRLLRQLRIRAYQPNLEPH